MQNLKQRTKTVALVAAMALLLMAWCFTPCSLLAQGGHFTHQPYGNDVYVGFTHQSFGNSVDGGFTHQSFGNSADGGFTHQSFGNGVGGGFTHQGFGNDVGGGFTHQPFGNDVSLGGGLLILLSAGASYAALKRTRQNNKQQ